MNHTEQRNFCNRIFDKLNYKVAGFRIEILNKVTDVWLLKSLMNHFQNDEIIFADFPFDSYTYQDADFQYFLKEICDKLMLSKCSTQTSSEIINEIVSKLEEGEHIILSLTGVDKQPKSYLDQILDKFWQPLIQRIKEHDVDIKSNCWMYWLDLKNRIDWRESYIIPNDHNSESPYRLYSICNYDKFKRNDLQEWIKGERGKDVITRLNSSLVTPENIDKTIEQIWRESDEGKSIPLLQAIYKICGLPWEEHKSKWERL